LSSHSSSPWSSVSERRKDWGEIKEMGIREREKNKGVKERYRDKRKRERQGRRMIGIRDKRKWERQGRRRIGIRENERDKAGER
jgi:hypothetical protein